MHFILGNYDTFEPWWVTVSLPLSITFTFGAILALLVRLLFNRYHFLEPTRSAIFTHIAASALVLMALAVGVTYHVRIREPIITRYEHENRRDVAGSSRIRKAANRLLHFQIDWAAAATVLNVAAAIVTARQMNDRATNSPSNSA